MGGNCPMASYMIFSVDQMAPRRPADGAEKEARRRSGDGPASGVAVGGAGRRSGGREERRQRSVDGDIF